MWALQYNFINMANYEKYSWMKNSYNSILLTIREFHNLQPKKLIRGKKGLKKYMYLKEDNIPYILPAYVNILIRKQGQAVYRA